MQSIDPAWILSKTNQENDIFEKFEKFGYGF